METGSQPRVSVILTTYNRAGAYLSESLASIAAQTRPVDEIVVVDDGSTDQTADVVAGFAGDSLRYIRQSNQGRPAALNTGIRAASGDYVLCFDDDDVLLPNAIALHLNALATGAQADYTYSRYFHFEDPEGTDDIWQRQAWRASSTVACDPDRFLLGVMEWIGATLSGMLIARACFDRVGVFDASLLRAQDYEFMVRLARVCRSRFLDDATFVRREHDGLRGPARERVAGTNRKALSHRYEQQIFRGFRRDMALAEYLPRDPRAAIAETLTEAQHQQALVARARIMFAHALYEQGGADLAVVLAQAKYAPVGGADVEALFFYASNIGNANFQLLAVRCARALCQACRAREDRLLLRAARRGFYWTGHRALRRKHWQALLYVAAAAARVELRRLRLACGRASIVTRRRASGGSDIERRTP